MNNFLVCVAGCVPPLLPQIAGSYERPSKACYRFGRISIHKNSRRSQNSKAGQFYLSHQQLNTYRPLDIGEATEQEEQIEHSSWQGGAAGQLTFRASPAKNCVQHVILSPPPQDHNLHLLLRGAQFQHHVTWGQCMRWGHNGPWSRLHTNNSFIVYCSPFTGWIPPCDIYTFVSEGQSYHLTVSFSSTLSCWSAQLQIKCVRPQTCDLSSVPDTKGHLWRQKGSGPI